jgi:hypothetical protein
MGWVKFTAIDAAAPPKAMLCNRLAPPLAPSSDMVYNKSVRSVVQIRYNAGAIFGEKIPAVCPVSEHNGGLTHDVISTALHCHGGSFQVDPNSL